MSIVLSRPRLRWGLDFTVAAIGVLITLASLWFQVERGSGPQTTPKPSTEVLVPSGGGASGSTTGSTIASAGGETGDLISVDLSDRGPQAGRPGTGG